MTQPDLRSDSDLIALDEAGVGMWSLDIPTGIARLNATCARLFGLSGPGEMQLADLQNLVHPDDRPHRAAVLDHALRNGGPYEADYRVGDTGAPARWVKSHGRVFLKDGRPVFLRGVIIGIDAQKAAEAELRAREQHLSLILDTVPQAMIVIDERGVMRSFSKAAERLFGLLASEAIGQNVSMLMPEPDRSRHDSYLGRYALTGERRIIGTGRVVTGRRRDGSIFPMELNVGEMRSADRVFYTGFVNDLTERQETQARLQELQAELVHISRLTAMGEMASTLAHELNQPLASVSNYLKGCGRLLDGGDPAQLTKVRDALDKAAGEAMRAGQIIRRLRDFVSHGETDKRPERVSRLIEEASALALVGVQEAGVTSRLDFGPEDPSVLADRVQIQQILINLLRNAIEAMAGAPTRELKVTVRRMSGEVVIEVADTGSGIAPEVAERLFQPFVTSKRHGMGVGLSISRTIAEAHGGRLWATPGATGGTVFHLALPVIAEARGDG